MKVYDTATETVMRNAKQKIDEVCKLYNPDFVWIYTSAMDKVIVKFQQGSKINTYIDSHADNALHIDIMISWYKIIRELISKADNENDIELDYSYSHNISMLELRTDDLVVYYK